MSASVVMYCTAVCGYCRRAEALLAARGVHEIEKRRIDLDASLMAEMVERTARRTVPQIFINGQHVGGYDDLAAADRDGALSKLLNG